MPIPEHCAKVAFCRNYDIITVSEKDELTHPAGSGWRSGENGG